MPEAKARKPKQSPKGGKPKEGKKSAKKETKGAGQEEARKEAAPEEVLRKDYRPRLQKLFETEYVPLLMKEFNYTNRAQVPRLH
ncbi:MAG: hypothetical protein Q8R92_00235, partial [Deltaproteobacteria bacterium]|nr:hypothetical protein [Deltaproteobacteria bacterium]